MTSWIYEYRARVLDITDGDTITVEIDRGFDDRSTKTMRLHDIDAYELRGEERPLGILAKQAVETWVDEVRADPEEESWPFAAVSYKWQGKYGRWIADLRDRRCGESLSKRLVRLGHAEQVDY